MSLIIKEDLIDCLNCGVTARENTNHNVYVSLDTVLRTIRAFPEAPSYEPKKCSSNGVIFKPDGINELDPCVYKEVEAHRNVTVRVLKCRKCGHVELEWKRQWNTEDILEE